MLWKIPVMVVLSGLLGACVYHIDTAIPAELVEFNPALVGTWMGDDDTERVVIASGWGAGYRIEYTERNGTIDVFHGRSGRLGNRSVLEVWPAYRDADGWPVGRLLLVIDLTGSDMVVRLLDTAALRRAPQGDLRDVRLCFEAHGPVRATRHSPRLAQS